MSYSYKYFKVSNNPGTTQSRTPGFSYNTLVSINPDMTLSVFSGILSYKIQLNLELKVHHKYHSQYQSGNDSACVLQYRSYNIQLNVIPNLYLSFKKVIQDASCLLTRNNYSHIVIKAEYYSK